MCMRVCVREEGVGASGAGVMGGCEPPEWVLGTKLTSSERHLTQIVTIYLFTLSLICYLLSGPED